MSSELGVKIQKLRKEQKLTLDELAKKAGVSKSYLWELENRTPPSPSAAKLKSIAEQLKKPLEYFLDDDGKMSEQVADDIAFFRKYQTMPEETKRKIRKVSEAMWDDDD